MENIRTYNVLLNGSYRQQRVRPSLRPSDTRRYCVKTKKASVMISSPSGSPAILVFWCQISSRHSKGLPLSEGLKHGWGGKIQPFSSFKHQ